MAHRRPVPPAEFRRTTHEIVDEFGLARRTVYQWQAEGRVNVWKLGPRINLYDRREFEAQIVPGGRRSA